jgi:hypothetical protein
MYQVIVEQKEVQLDPTIASRELCHLRNTRKGSNTMRRVENFYNFLHT